MSDYRRYQHLYPSLEVYPRVQYFHERFSDLLVRFKRVIAVLPNCFRDKNIETELEQLKSAFEWGVEVTVIAQEDIDDINLVGKATTTPRESRNLQTHDSQRIKVAVCSIKQDYLDEKRLKTINEVIGLAYPEHKPRLLILKCDKPEEDIETFKDFLRRYLEFEDIFICSENSKLKQHVSDLLESQITAGFLKISSSLQQFESDDIEHYEINDEIINSPGVVNSFHDFLSEYSLRDITEEAESKNEDSSDSLIRHLCKVIKCIAVLSFARKYHLPLWVCNRILHEIQLEEALARTVHEDVPQYLREIAIEIKPLSHLSKKCRKRETIGKKLLPNMKSTFAETEKKFSGMMHLGMVMKKMRFETDGYVKQTNLGLSWTQKESVSSKLGIHLRQELLSINGVYGLGTIYGKLEIHLDLSLDKDKKETKMKEFDDSCLQYIETKEIEVNDAAEKSKSSMSNSHKKPDKTENSLPNIRADIENTLKKHRFVQPFTVKFVRKSPKVLNNFVDPGDRIHSQKDKTYGCKVGTIGGYVVTKDKTLYGLTCYHVIGEDGKLYTDNGKKHFGDYRKGMENDTDPFIDIAAVEVILQEEYKKHLEQAVTRVSKVKLSFEETDELIGRYVHKFGAVTGVTKGTILTLDYNLYPAEAHNYLIVIDTLAAENDIGDVSEVFTTLVGASASNASAGLSVAQSMTENLQEEPKLCMIANKTITKLPKSPIPSACHSSENPENVCDSSHQIYKKYKERTVAQAPNASSVAVVSLGIEKKNMDQSSGKITEKKTNANCCPSFTIFSDRMAEKNCNLDTEKTFKVKTKFKHLEHERFLLSGMKESTEQGKNLNLLVYVRDFFTATETDESCENKVFSKEGDSGAIICCPDPSTNGLTCLALSMLTGGDFEIGGHHEQKSLSFTLRKGLANIKDKCGLDLDL